MWSIAAAGLVLGLISSLHCIGMCGPLMLALPVRHMDKWKQVLAIFLYNTGRIITYSLLGALLGLAGRRIYLAGFQRWFTIILGIVMLVLAMNYFYKQASAQPKWMQSIHLRIQQLMLRFLRSNNISGYFLLGMANGLLPCGMVYLAIAGAVTANTVFNSVLFMFLFGVGTLPAMLALGIFGLRITMPVRQQMKAAMPYVVVAMAVILILRGCNLGIPFISPVIADVPGHVISCH
ncbi:MAG: sulfite exporter TauE/SafE family protein [Niastella sp.]|jgi:sulfite exporter TauE/SafE|uniref:sulfite exporter TauE/SafE family protein n=1 Tax=Niastella sp. TaxID=1869183 RepID=UPI00389AAE7E